MLANLLPGLRELRTPLAVGWTWLVALWVALGALLPSKQDTSGLLRSVYELAEEVGKGGVVAALAFVAYLFGSLLQLDPAKVFKAPHPHMYEDLGVGEGRNWIKRRFERMRAIRLQPYLPLVHMIRYTAEEQERAAGREGALEELKKMLFGPQGEMPYRFSRLDVTVGRDWGVLIAAAGAILMVPIELETQLLAKKREVYDFYDRLRESADLRVSLTPAVGALGVAIAIRLIIDDHPWWGWLMTLLVACAVAAALWLRGEAQYYRSQLALATAVATDVVGSPVLERWKLGFNSDSALGGP